MIKILNIGSSIPQTRYEQQFVGGMFKKILDKLDNLPKNVDHTPRYDAPFIGGKTKEIIEKTVNEVLVKNCNDICNTLKIQILNTFHMLVYLTFDALGAGAIVAYCYYCFKTMLNFDNNRKDNMLRALLSIVMAWLFRIMSLYSHSMIKV